MRSCRDSELVVEALEQWRASTFRSSLKPAGDGTHYLVANKSMLKGANASAGDTVHLVLELDTAERTVTVPKELESALKGSIKASHIFGELAYSCRKEYAVWIDGAKKQETRVSRADKAIAMLLSGNGRRIDPKTDRA